jgi:hypothetical protein
MKSGSIVVLAVDASFIVCERQYCEQSLTRPHRAEASFHAWQLLIIIKDKVLLSRQSTPTSSDEVQVSGNGVLLDYIELGYHFASAAVVGHYGG